MSHIFKKENLILVLIMGLLLIPVGLSFAELTMDEVRTMFQREVGERWEDAEAQEQKKFLRRMRGEEDEPEGKVKEIEKEKKITVISGTSQISEMLLRKQNSHKKAPFYVRDSFEKETGIRWKDATKQKQTAFWRRYEVADIRMKQEKAVRERNERIQEQVIKKDRSRKEQKLMIDKKKKAQKERLKVEKERHKHEEEKRRMTVERQKSKAFRQELRQMHDRSRSR